MCPVVTYWDAAICWTKSTRDWTAAAATVATPVEALDRHLTGDVGLGDLTGDHLDELLAWSGLSRCMGLDVGRDVQHDAVRVVAVHEREDVAQLGHPGLAAGEGSRPAAANRS
jgi:hypothetical protein